MYYKVKEDGRVQTRCVCNILGINKEGKKDVLGMYVSQSAGANFMNFWLFNELRRKNRIVLPPSS